MLNQAAHRQALTAGTWRPEKNRDYRRFLSHLQLRSSSHFKPTQGGCWRRLAHEDWQSWAMNIEVNSGCSENNAGKQYVMVLTSNLIEVLMIFRCPVHFSTVAPIPLPSPAGALIEKVREAFRALPDGRNSTLSDSFSPSRDLRLSCARMPYVVIVKSIHGVANDNVNYYTSIAYLRWSLRHSSTSIRTSRLISIAFKAGLVR